MRTIEIRPVSDFEVLIHDDAAFLMLLRPGSVEAAGRNFVGLSEPERWWLKLECEAAFGGRTLWLRQEPLQYYERDAGGTLIDAIGQLTAWDERTRRGLAIANQLLAKPTQYAVAWMEENRSYYGAVCADPSWIQPPNRVALLVRRTINDREGWEQLQTDARLQARRLGIPFVNNLDPDPD